LKCYVGKIIISCFGSAKINDIFKNAKKMGVSFLNVYQALNKIRFYFAFEIWVRVIVGFLLKVGVGGVVRI
jgi:5-formaminoimidazole-4-carboxamide-1-beta-D-ribofuranosyl 5'-monophosphate synthetase